MVKLLNKVLETGCSNEVEDDRCEGNADHSDADHDGYHSCGEDVTEDIYVAAVLEIVLKTFEHRCLSDK